MKAVSESIESGMAEELRQLPEQLSLYQKQAQKFVENILDVDRIVIGIFRINDIALRSMPLFVSYLF